MKTFENQAFADVCEQQIDIGSSPHFCHSGTELLNMAVMNMLMTPIIFTEKLVGMISSANSIINDTLHVPTYFIKMTCTHMQSCLRMLLVDLSSYRSQFKFA